MSLSNLRTATGNKLRGEGRKITSFPIPYDPSVSPGAIIMAGGSALLDGSDTGRPYISRTQGGIWRWLPIVTIDNNGTTLRHERASNDTHAIFRFSRQRAGLTPLESGDVLGEMSWSGRATDGGRVTASSILAVVSDVPENDSVPTELQISVTPLGSNVPLLAATFSQDGNLLLGNTTGTERLSVTGNIQITDPANSYKVGNNDVVGSRKTGWAAPTGTATRTTFDTGTVTLVQLAERHKALIDDLIAHGLIGPTP